MIKRLADWFEKMSIAALAVGMFQAGELTTAIWAMLLGVASFSISMYLSWRMEGRNK